MIETLVNYGIDINDIEDTIFTELMEETRQSHIEIINLLIKNGANVNATNKNGVTPLTISVKSGQSEIAKHLIAHSTQLLNGQMNTTVLNKYKTFCWKMVQR